MHPRSWLIGDLKLLEIKPEFQLLDEISGILQTNDYNVGPLCRQQPQSLLVRVYEQRINSYRV